MGAPFTVNSPVTEQVVYTVDGQGNSTQTGNGVTDDTGTLADQIAIGC
jgi:hypothetical protein